MFPLQSTQKNAPGGKSYFLFILVAIAAIGSGLLVQSSKTPPAEQPEFKKTILLPNTKPLVDVNFVDHKGQKFGIEHFKGKWSILFFGFTNCPDICPTTLQTLKQVKSDLEQANAWHNYQLVMVSVDPERDTTERLANYVPYFDPEFIGVSGPLESTTSFAKNVGILFFKSEMAANGGYDVDHGAAIILVNPEGRYAGVITAPHIQSTISEDLIALANYAGIDATKVKTTPSNHKADPKQVVGGTATVSNPGQALVFENAWIRPAPPGVENMAAYFDLVNTSEYDIVIQKSSSPSFEVTMIHTSTVKDGVAGMRHLEELTIPAKSKVSLAPLGIHMMLMGPKQGLNLNDNAEISLVAKDGSIYRHTVTVKPQANKPLN